MLDEKLTYVKKLGADYILNFKYTIQRCWECFKEKFRYWLCKRCNRYSWK
jgi:hypothetical protein